MFKILSMTLILTLAVANYTQATEQPPEKPYQNEPMQGSDTLKQPKTQPNNHDQNMTTPRDNMTPPDGETPSKGKRPNQKPDKQPGGNKVPPELQ